MYNTWYTFRVLDASLRYVLKICRVDTKDDNDFVGTYWLCGCFDGLLACDAILDVKTHSTIG